MQANQQQQQQSQSARKSASQNLVDADSQELSLCPNCGAELDAEALFCPECSTMVKQHVCPKCGHANTWTSDICQYCHTWLLEKQCKFCYAEIEDGASFCPECGKPKEGIPCPHCGTLSIFDFCPKCGKPVTEEAVAELQTAQAEKPPVPVDPQTVAMEAELAKLDAVINSAPAPVYIEPEVIDDYNDVYDPDDYYEEPVVEDEPVVVEEEPVRVSLFSDKQMSSIRQTGDDIDDANRQRAEQARIAEERRIEAERQAEERRREAARIAAEKREAERQAEARRQAAEAQRAATEQRQREAQQRQQEAARQAQQRQQAANAQQAANEAERQRQVREAQIQKEAIQRKMDQDRVAARAAQKDREIAVAKQNASRRFANNQEARNFHNARRHPDSLGWLCNAYGNVHLYSDGGPNECNEPAKGGCDYFGEIVRDGDWYKPKR